MTLERLQKILARAGIGSRRAAELLISARRVRVNGRIVSELGTKADPRRDRVEVDGKRVVSEKPVYYLMNKPRETVTTADDPEGRPTTAQILKAIPERVFTVGRLDYNTSGALLITNDGELAQALLHPRKGVPKSYVVKLQGILADEELVALREGVEIGPGEKTGRAQVAIVRQERGNTWLQVTLTEGKNRQIHRMAEAIGRRVLRLSRFSFAGLTIEGLRLGLYRPLTATEAEKLKRDYVGTAIPKPGKKLDRTPSLRKGATNPKPEEEAERPHPLRKGKPKQRPENKPDRPRPLGKGASKPKQRPENKPVRPRFPTVGSSKPKPRKKPDRPRSGRSG